MAPTGTHPDPAGADLARSGLRLASTRASQSLGLGSPQPLTRLEVETAAGEALFWTSVLHEIERSRLGTAYRAAIELSSEGRIVKGLLWARNSLAHGAIVVHAGLVSGETTIAVGEEEITVVGSSNERHALHWRRSEEIAIRNRARDLRSFYDHHLAGKWVQDSFEAAMAWFAEIAST